MVMMNELTVALLTFLATTVLFLSSTIYYKRRFIQEETDKVIYRNFFLRLRDHGMEHVKKHLNMNHMIKYRNEITKIDEKLAFYRSDK